MQLRQLALLALLALLAAPAWGQTTVESGRVQQVYTNGPYVCRNGLSMAKGTTGNACAISDVAGTAGLWIQGDTKNTVWGGVDLVPADNDFFARTSGAIPGVSGGLPAYPLTVVVWVKPDAVASTYRIWEWNDGTTNNRLEVNNAAGALSAVSRASATSVTASASSVFTSGRWTCCVVVFASDVLRAAYADTNTTGGTSTTSNAPSGLSGVIMGRNTAGANEFDGEIGPIWILSGDLSGAGNEDLRQAIFNGADPVLAAADVATLIVQYPMQDALGTSVPTGFELTPSGTPTATSTLLVVRDQSANTNHMRATTGAPTYDGTIMNGQGGGTYVAASSQFLVRDAPSGTPTAAPFQVYVVARANDVTSSHVTLALVDASATNQYFQLTMAGAVASDPVRWTVTGSSGTTHASTSSGYAASTNYLLWGLEASSSSRSVEFNGANTGTDSTSNTPSGIDRFSMGIRQDASPAGPLDGQLSLTWLLDTAATTGQARIERFTNTVYNLGF